MAVPSPPRVPEPRRHGRTHWRGAPPWLARDLHSVTFRPPSTPLSPGRLRMHPAICFH